MCYIIRKINNRICIDNPEKLSNAGGFNKLFLLTAFEIKRYQRLKLTKNIKFGDVIS